MGKFFQQIEATHKTFIEQQHMFFVASAPMSEQGHINLSPKGLDSFKVLSDHQVGYMDLISSGNETSAHTLENGRLTIMFCSFKEKPLILKLYGKGRTVLPESAEWDKYAAHFTIYDSTRQLILLEVHLVQTSCGFGVPRYDFIGDRDIHFNWAEKKGRNGLDEYINKNNLQSIDGLPSNLGVARSLDKNHIK